MAHPARVKGAVLAGILLGEPLRALSRRYNVSLTTVFRWSHDPELDEIRRYMARLIDTGPFAFKRNTKKGKGERCV